MGVEFSLFLLPTPRDVVPSAAQVAEFGNELRRGRWLESTDDPTGKRDRAIARGARMSGYVPETLTTGWVESYLGGDFFITWPVWEPVRAGGRDVLGGSPRRSGLVGYNIEFLSSDRYIYPQLACVEDLPILRCPCGEDLLLFIEDDETLPGARRVALACDACGAPFNPGHQQARYEDPWTGGTSLLTGGCCFRFAIEVACGPFHPTSGFKGHADPEFIQACERIFRCPCIEVSDAA